MLKKREARARMHSTSRWIGACLALTVLLTAGCRQHQEQSPNRIGPLPLPSGEPAPEAAVAWIREHEVPFQSEEPTAPEDAGLLALRKAAATARIVALGEATHGSHQFFRMKHRIIQDLVSHQNVKTFAMEADGAGSCAIDEYIHTGTGDPAQLIHDLVFWTWNTEEFLALVRWMRSYNQSVGPERALSFRGIDMQNPLALSRRVVSFLQQADPAESKRVESAYRCLGPLEDHDALEEGYLKEDIVKQMQCATSIAAIHQQISRNRERYERISPSGYACALWNAHLMVQAEELLRFPSTRDHLYADNLLALAADPSGKVIVWAHNGHVGNLPGAMGRRLKRELRDDYLIVGLTSYGGSFRARTRKPDGGAGPPVPITALPAPDSYEAAFHRAGQKRALIDLRSLRLPGSEPSWLTGLHPLRDVGGAYDPRTAASAVRLPEAFDFLIFFDSTNPSILLPKLPGRAQ